MKDIFEQIVGAIIPMVANIITHPSWNAILLLQQEFKQLWGHHDHTQN